MYEVTDGSLADGVLESGDVLLYAALNGKTVEITRQYHLIDIMLDVRVGDTVVLGILRGEQEMTVAIDITQQCLSEYS